MLRVYKAADYGGMSQKAAGFIAAQVLMNPACVLGLATGSTPVGAYRQLIEWYQKGGLSLKGVRSVNLDEYKGLAPTHDQSYRYFMQENLFSHIDIKAENTHVPNGQAADAVSECARYDRLVQELGGVDLQLLGMGHNGHIGFNEPCEYFPVGTHVVDLAESTINANTRFFASRDDVPRQALTMGVGTIMSARRVLVAVSGVEKADIVAKAFAGPVTPQVPASVLQLHPDVVLVGDEAALAKLLETGVSVCG